MSFGAVSSCFVARADALSSHAHDFFCKDFVPSGWMMGSAGMNKPLAAAQALVWTPAMDSEGFFALVVS